MRTVLIASSLFLAGFVLDGARAANDPPASDYRAASTDEGRQAPNFGFDPRRPECGASHLSMIWGPDRQPGAYECLGRAKGF